MAQTVEDVSFNLGADSTVQISYFLKIPNESRPVWVSVEVSTNGGGTFATPRSVSGDVGEVYRSGSKYISWDALNDFDRIETERFMVRVTAKPEETVTGVLGDLFFGSTRVREHVGGWTLYASGYEVILKNPYFRGLEATGLTRDRYAYGGGLRFTYLPFVFDVNGFYRQFRLATITVPNATPRQFGCNISSAVTILPLWQYLIPHVGGGYQISQVLLELDTPLGERHVVSTSAPFLSAGVSIALTRGFVVAGEYRQSFSFTREDVERLRGWKQWSVTAGIHFGNPDSPR
jgi:hypothetical protein